MGALMIGTAISLFHDVVTGGSAVANIYKVVSGIIRGDKTEQYLKQVAEHVGDIRVHVERLSDKVLYAADLQAVRDVTQSRQRMVDDLREVRESLEPLSQTTGQEILSSAMIWTPDKMQKAMHKDPWDVLHYIRPLSYASSVSYPDMVPVLFEDPDSRVQYVGWAKRGMLLPAFDCEYEDLWVPRKPEGSISSLAPEAQPTPPKEKIPPAVPKRSERPALFPVEDVHGWSADKVQALQQSTAQALSLPLPFRDRLANGSEGPEMMVIPAGSFLMGSPEDEKDREYTEHQHSVTIGQPFAIGCYAVTFEEYDRFREATRNETLDDEGWEQHRLKVSLGLFRETPNDKGWGRGRRPVIYISWHDAMAYAEWLSEQTGQQYRLPTEAEWEYAARAGTVTPFHFGQNITKWQVNHTVDDDNDDTRSAPVGQFPPNSWGLYDMHGNVFEWTCSIHEDDYDGYEQHCVRSWDTSPYRVVRGGSMDSLSDQCRSAYRDFRDCSKDYNYDLGFRLVRQIKI